MPHVGKRRARPAEDTPAVRREEILAAAATVFAECGYAETEMQAVADRCGVAKGTIYLYFPSKEKLFLATVDRAMTRLRESVRSAYEPVADPLERLEVAIRAYLEFFRDHRHFAELLIIERAVYRDRKTPTYLEHRKAHRGEWEKVYADLIEAGRMRDIPVNDILRFVSDLVYGTMFTNHFAGHEYTPAEQAHILVDILFHGLLSPSERRKRSRMG